MRYRYQNVPYDRPGRYVYIRDHQSGKYWSAAWTPVHTPMENARYTCRVGTNYQIITFEYDEIRTEIRYFVPPKGALEIWDFHITNLSQRPRELSTYSYAEFAFWGAMRDLMNIDNCPNLSRQHEEDGTILHYSFNDIGTELNNMCFVQNYGFHTSTPRCDAFNGDRDKFLGLYRDEKNPIVVETGKSTNWCKWGGYPIGSMEHRFTLAPGESKRIVYRTGVSQGAKTWKRDARQYATFEQVDTAFATVKEQWRSRLGKFQVDTPDSNFNTLINGFVQYQAATTMRLSRSISSYEWGIRRSIGFRDSSQDQLGMMHAFPEVARKMLIDILRAISPKGEACHDFNPITDAWGDGGFYDDQNWPSLSVNQYVRETGDVAFLKFKVPYVRSKKTGTVFEHLKAAQDFSWSKRGRNGLMQVGCADWNDSLNPGDKTTESVFTSALYCAGTLALIELANLLGEKRLVVLWQKRYDTIKQLLNTVAWDGGWYQRLIKTNGTVLGSRKTKEYGRIFVEPQPWAVIAGVAEGKRATLTLDNVEKHLGTPDGHKIMDRPFLRFDWDEVGSASVVPGGIKENGSVFNHASSWMITAECIVGRGNKAYEYFTRKAGTTKNTKVDLYESEPYVSCQFVSQKPFHIVGRGRNAWLTGSAAWIARGAMQGIIGCRPDFDGLIIDPCIPSHWKGFHLIREFRGVTYDITVSNPYGIEKGVKELTVDGKAITGNKIPFKPSRKTVMVQAIMSN